MTWDVWVMFCRTNAVCLTLVNADLQRVPEAISLPVVAASPRKKGEYDPKALGFYIHVSLSLQAYVPL